MSETRKDGGPAFGHGDRVNGGDPGMSLRDYFAGQIIAGFAANPDIRINLETTPGAAYQMADAMLAAREAADTEGE